MYIYPIIVTGDDHSKQEPTKTLSTLTLDCTVDVLTVTGHMPDTSSLCHSDHLEDKKKDNI